MGWQPVLEIHICCNGSHRACCFRPSLPPAFIVCPEFVNPFSTSPLFLSSTLLGMPSCLIHFYFKCQTMSYLNASSSAFSFVHFSHVTLSNCIDRINQSIRLSRYPSRLPSILDTYFYSANINILVGRTKANTSKGPVRQNQLGYII